MNSANYLSNDPSCMYVCVRVERES